MKNKKFICVMMGLFILLMSCSSTLALPSVVIEQKDYQFVNVTTTDLWDLLDTPADIGTSELNNDAGFLSSVDISTNTNLAVSGTLLDLTGDTLSVLEGTLTNGAYCIYTTGTGLVCDSNPYDNEGEIAGLTFLNSTYGLNNTFNQYLDLYGSNSMMGNIKLNGYWLSNDGGNEGIFVSTTGNVGIGTTSPAGKLDIAGSSANLVFSTAVGAGETKGINLTTDGNWFIGMAQPSASDYRIRVGVPGDAAARSFEVYDTTGKNSRLFIAMQSGNVGIGTTSPTYPLTVFGNVSTVSIWADGNVSATGYITRTSVFDKSKDVWDYIKDSDYYKIAGKIDHTKFYGYVEYPNTDFNRPVEEEYQEEECNEVVEENCKDFFGFDKPNCTITYKTECNNITKTRITYPYTIQEQGVDLGKEIDVLRQAIYELKQENEELRARIEVLEND